MATYHFHVTRAHGDVSKDSVELDDVHCAKREAQKLASALIAEDGCSVWENDVAVTLTNDDGLTIGAIEVIGVLSPAYRSSDPNG